MCDSAQYHTGKPQEEGTVKRNKFVNFKKWMKSGGGEFVSAALTLSFLIQILMIAISIVITDYSVSQMEYAISVAARRVVVCESAEEALSTAREVIQQSNLPSCISVDDVWVEYVAGSEHEWKKGNYVDVGMHANITSSSPFVETSRFTHQTVMIERIGDG